MRYRLPALLSAIALLAGATGAAAAPIDAPLVASDNVRFVTQRPEAAGAISLQFSSTSPHAYVSTVKGLHVYDVSDPLAPSQVGYLPMVAYQNEAMSLGERPNGEKFVVIASNGAVATTTGFTDTSNRAIVVVEVTTPSAPTIVAARQVDTRTHTVSCGTPTCEYAYSDGRSQGAMSIIDLTDFRNPKMAGTYASVVPGGHDEDVDGAGILWHVGMQGSVALDISDPTKPVPLNSTNREGLSSGDHRGQRWNNFIHHNSARPNAESFSQQPVLDEAGTQVGLDSGEPALERGNVLLVTEEDYLQTSAGAYTATAQGEPTRCGDFEGSFQTWHIPYLDADQYAADNPATRQGGGSIAPLDLWNTELLQSGITTPAGAFCSAHYFDYHDAGFVTQGWYQQGTRILDVRNPRDIKQVGYFFTGALETWASYWVPEHIARGHVAEGRTIVYSTDAVRGLDVLEVALPTSAPEATTEHVAPILSSWLPGAVPATSSSPSPEWGWACRLPQI